MWRQASCEPYDYGNDALAVPLFMIAEPGGSETRLIEIDSVWTVDMLIFPSGVLQKIWTSRRYSPPRQSSPPKKFNQPRQSIPTRQSSPLRQSVHPRQSSSP
jgi:hypothetical protein